MSICLLVYHQTVNLEALQPMHLTTTVYFRACTPENS